MENDYIKIIEWAKLNGLTKGYAYSLVKRNLLPGVQKVNGVAMVPRDAKHINAKSKGGTLAGKEAGNVRIMERTEKKVGTQYIYNCICLRCGRQFEAVGSAVMRGDITNCKACGKVLARTRVAENLAKDRVDGTRISTLTAKTRSDNTSGHKGVYKVKAANLWAAYIDFKGKRYHLGRYVEFGDAVKARERAEADIFAPFLEDAEQRQDHDEPSVDFANQKGVYFSQGSWRVMITRDKKSYYFGRFASVMDAQKVYAEAAAIKTVEGLIALRQRVQDQKKSERQKKTECKNVSTRQPKYVGAVSMGGKTVYRVLRTINGKRIYFGVYDDRDVAVQLAKKVAAAQTEEELLALRSATLVGKTRPR